MPATKRKYLVEKTAKELNMSADDIDDIIYSYYNHVLKLINSLEHTLIYVNNVCTFKFRVAKSAAYVQHGEKLLERWRLRKPTKYLLESISEVENRVIKLKKLIEIMYQQYDAKKIKRKERYEFIKSMASQESDTGRDIK
ncbi:MAG TPA: hypothetical protein P5513_01295 [Candidatus Diapherotrites archaeon]|nr:hypothetical protein [Candidatus Diapherotrites archaeon]